MLDVSSPDFRAAVDKRDYFAGDSGIRGIIQRQNLDVIAIPNTLGMTVPSAARGGLPPITVPLGTYPQDTPVKLSQNSTVDDGPNVP